MREDGVEITLKTSISLVVELSDDQLLIVFGIDMMAQSKRSETMQMRVNDT